MSKRHGFGSLLLGGAIGAGLALLFAPKKGEELRLPSMYQSIPFKVSRINDDDSVLIKTNMKFFLKKDYSDGGFEEFTISPGENKTLYFDGMDTDGFVTVRYEKQKELT